MSTSVRKQKSGDQLAVGDWLAPGEILDGAAEVLHVLKYRPKDTIAEDWHVHLVVREQGMVAPYADVVSGARLAELASEEDLAKYQEDAQRVALADQLHRLADLIVERKLPVPAHALSLRAYVRKASAVRVYADALGVEVQPRGSVKGTEAYWLVGGKSYEPGALEFSVHTSEVEPEPEPVADPTGLAYSRPADDPTPVSGARVEPHVGAVTEAGLVDETEMPDCSEECSRCEAEHLDDCPQYLWLIR